MIFGTGVNDVEEGIAVDGKHKPFYRCWKDMLRRCYSAAALDRNPTYAGCTVCEDWLSLAKFQNWFNDNYTEGHQLDKDIIKPGNKLYAPKLCCFVSPDLNKLLTDHRNASGPYPTGVHKRFDKTCAKRFVARCNYKGVRRVVGYFGDPTETHAAYLTFKSKCLLELAVEQTDIRVARGLRLHARLKSDEARTMSRG